MYAGRFAPSPTGPLHFGSLVAALASWLDARAAGGRWLVRIEDLDPPRAQPGAADDILRALDALGLQLGRRGRLPEPAPPLYEDALRALQSTPIRAAARAARSPIPRSGSRPTARRSIPAPAARGLAPGKARARAAGHGATDATIAFDDRVQGRRQQQLEREVGDFVLCRADGQFAYQLAVVVDDAAQGITDVVRGADLLDSTRAPDLSAAAARATRRRATCTCRWRSNAAGEKLSKQTGARAVDARAERALRRALAFLGQPPSRPTCARGGRELGSRRSSPRAARWPHHADERADAPGPSAPYSDQLGRSPRNSMPLSTPTTGITSMLIENTVTGTEVAILIQAQCAKAKARNTL